MTGREALAISFLTKYNIYSLLKACSRESAFERRLVIRLWSAKRPRRPRARCAKLLFPDFRFAFGDHDARARDVFGVGFLDDATQRSGHDFGVFLTRLLSTFQSTMELA